MNKILPIISIPIFLPAAFNICYPIYKMTVMDAKARGLPLEEIREEIEWLLEDYDE